MATADSADSTRDIDGFLRQMRPCALDGDCFVFEHEPAGRRQFGGITLGQALVAAAQTVDGLAPHSLHTLFLRPHLPGGEVRYAVERVRDGRRFAMRRVQALEGDQLLNETMAGFTTGGAGLAYQAAAPRVPPPEELPEFAPFGAGGYEQTSGRAGFLFEQRLARWQGPRSDGTNLLDLWARPLGAIPANPVLRAAALAALSDLGSHLIGLEPGASQNGLAAASLDHKLWLHVVPPLDDWLLFVRESSVSVSGRVLMTGAIYTRDGVRCASLAQESLQAGEV